MKLYLNDKEHDVILNTILTPALYEKVTPLFNKLASSDGTKAFAEQEMMEKVFAHPKLSTMIDITKGEKGFEKIVGMFEFQEIVKLTYLRIRKDLFDIIHIDSNTIPMILDLFRVAIDMKKVKEPLLIEALNTEYDSEFWRSQDIGGIVDSLKFFRETVCARVRIQ
jgi:hypothetical protein